MKLSTVLFATSFLLVSATAMADTTTTHMTGHLATKDTFGSWTGPMRVELPSGTTVVDVSASATGRNTFLDCTFKEPTIGRTVVQKHVQLCDVNVKGLVLPSHLTVNITNDNDSPVDYDITIQNTK